MNDDHDCGLTYQARRFWKCAANCPDGVCDHRTLEPVWDYLYVGGRVEGEDDLAKLTINPSPLSRETKIRLEVESGGELVRFWPEARKGNKQDILSATRLNFTVGDLPPAIYLEGIGVGTAKLRLLAEMERADESFVLFVDVVRLVESRKGKRLLIYSPGEISLKLEPEEALASRAYARQIAWAGDASGIQQSVSVSYRPGDDFDSRRVIYRPRVTIGGGLTLTRNIRVRNMKSTGTKTASDIRERRRQVESLIDMPAHGLLQTALPNKRSVKYSQAWFERWYTGSPDPDDPIKSVNQARLQYAPAYDAAKGGFWGVACCYRNPYGVFITKKAFDDGLSLEDIRGVAIHERQHLVHYMEMHNASGLWHVLCRDLDHETATDFMEADAEAATLGANASCYFINTRVDFIVKRYRDSVASVGRLPSLPQRTAGIKVLHDIYAAIPPDMVEFKRPDYDCYIRPPLEIDE